jgi:hypothetical protein
MHHPNTYFFAEKIDIVGRSAPLQSGCPDQILSYEFWRLEGEILRNFFAQIVGV